MDMMGSGANFGVMQAMRTGNPIVDVMVCMFIPMIISTVCKVDLYKTAIIVWEYIFPEPDLDWHIRQIKRDITDGMVPTNSVDKEHQDNESKNIILQKAVLLYLRAKYKNETNLQDVLLLPTKTVKLEQTVGRYGGQTESFTGSGTQLKSYDVVNVPTEQMVVQLTDKENELVFKQYVKIESGSKETGQPYKEELVYEVRASGEGGKQRVDGWINDAFAWYRNERSSEAKELRYFLQASDEDVEEDRSPYSREKPKFSNSAGICYKQYALSDEKTFDSLFFQEKDELLGLIDDFRDRRGKFGIRGFPKKLGLLLDGPPGTGKTSIIKALATYTKRHVVSISLEKIKSNQQLMDIMFELTFPIKSHEDGGLKLKMEDVIFVMEDVDCASKVVFARKNTKKYRKDGQGRGPMPADEDDIPPPPMLQRATTGNLEIRGAVMRQLNAIAVGHEPDPAWMGDMKKFCRNAQVAFGTMHPLLLKWSKDLGVVNFKEAISLLIQNEKDLPLKEMERKRIVREAKSLVDVESSESEDDDSDDDEPDESSNPQNQSQALKAFFSSGGVAVGGSKGKKKKKKGKDAAFTLAGLLNVLDGVVDSPGRIVIMTTNRPEKLDPALIRPGRINKRLHMGYLDADSLCLLAKHYLNCEVTPKDKQDTKKLLEQFDVTPAWAEQCCAESGSITELLQSLAKAST